MGRPPLPKNDTNRRCSKCKVTQPLSSFHNVKTDRLGRSRTCKNCAFSYNKWDRIRREYNISKEDYYSLLARQGSVCAICHRPEQVNNNSLPHHKPRGLAIDHDHTTGRVRGLLCFKCNSGIGIFDDDILRLESAIQYLKASQE